MRLRAGGPLLVLAAMTIPGSLAAQTMVTLEIPVNLTKLSPQVTQVQANCTLYSPGIAPPAVATVPRISRDNLTVLNGQVISTFRVVFELKAEELIAPIGKTVEYQCHLNAYTSKGWAGFSEDDPASPLYLKPTPKPIGGSFVW